MCSFCTHGQKQYTKKPLYKGLLMFIELFELDCSRRLTSKVLHYMDYPTNLIDNTRHNFI